ncbi:ATP synthase subunit alpha, partial [Capsicum annuum]
MIHKKSGRIQTHGQPAPDLLGRVAGLAPLIASILKIDMLHYPRPNLVSPTPLLDIPLPITSNTSLAAPNLTKIIFLITKQGSAFYISSDRSTIPTNIFFEVGAPKLNQPSKGA